MSPGYRISGVLLPEDRPVELFVDGAGVLLDGPLAGAETLAEGGWILPGLVDAHCHVGLGPDGPVDLEEADAQARTDRDAGALLIRDCGSPVDTGPLQARDDLPEIIRAARHIARPKRYLPGLAAELDDPGLLPEVVAEQAAAGDGWVKLVGDWIDRGAGDLTPLWPDDVLAAAIGAAHAAGARVTAHVFGTDALPGLIHAGIDCIEHGTGLTDDLIAEMARRGTALVPTLINVDTFPSIADSAARYPAYAAHMRELHRTAHDVARSRPGWRCTPAPTRAAGSATAGSPTRSRRWPAPASARPGRSAPRAGRRASGWAGRACTPGPARTW